MYLIEGPTHSGYLNVKSMGNFVVVVIGCSIAVAFT